MVNNLQIFRFKFANGNYKLEKNENLYNHTNFFVSSIKIFQEE
jgi:hypothetical protein